MADNAKPLQIYARSLGALLVLLAATIVAAKLPLGGWSVVVALAIAGLKAGIVATWFMHLRTSAPVMRLFALAGTFWLLVLLGLTLLDVQSRSG